MAAKSASAGTTASSGRADNAPAGEPLGRRLRRWYRPRVLMLLAVGLGVAILRPYIAPHLPDLAEQPDYQFATRDVRITKPNRWVPQDLVEQAVQRAGLPETVSLLDESLVEDMGRALAAHPWVSRVVRVRKSRSGVTADLEYRTPVMMVETRRGVYPVDLQGILLPPADFGVTDVARLPLVRNVQSLPDGPAGTPWNDEIVRGAARLAAALAPDQDLTRYWTRFSLTSIVAPAREKADASLADLAYELATRGGSRIVWGRAPGVDQLEPSVDQKLGRLEQYLASYGSFDQPHGAFRIDIRHFEVISRQPLGESRRR